MDIHAVISTIQINIFELLLVLHHEVNLKKNTVVRYYAAGKLEACTHNVRNWF